MVGDVSGVQLTLLKLRMIQYTQQYRVVYMYACIAITVDEAFESLVTGLIDLQTLLTTVLKAGHSKAGLLVNPAAVW